MFLALVGDLSNNPDTTRLARVLDAALAGNAGLSPSIPPADVVVQLGDLSGAYDVVKTRLPTGRLLVVPGNHDTAFDNLGLPRNWRREFPPLLTLIGLDTSADKVDDMAWPLLEPPAPVVPPVTPPATFVCCHKAPVPIVLPDLSLSTHIMGEGQPCPDATRLAVTVRTNRYAMAVGHYHAWSLQQAPGFPMICEGRGGAAPDLGYTLIGLRPEGWEVHSVPVV